MKNFNLNFRIRVVALFVAAVLCFSANKTFAQDIDPVNDTLSLVPAGSYVIAMDDTLQQDATTGLFNVKAYGLLATLLDNQIELFWSIRAGKVKNDTDFTATATRVFPTTQAAAIRRFRTGPFIVEPIDSFNFLATVSAFNAANTGHTVSVYQMTTSAKVDIRYVLRQKPRAAILNDGGNASIQLNYMTIASMPAANYTELSSASHLSDSCYTFASEPHNGSPVSSVIDSIHKFVTVDGGNFLAQCLAITEYENASNGRFQTTLGIVEAAPGNETTVYPHGDLSFSQFQDNFDGNLINSAVPSWELISGSVFTNSTQKIDRYSAVADSAIMTLSVSKNGTGAGHLVFYAGGHDYGDATNLNKVQGLRNYFDAMFTPSNVQSCAFLIFNNDLAVSKTAYHSTIAINQVDTFKIAITNTGPGSAVVDTVTATEVLPSGLTLISATPSKGTYNSGTGLWSVGNMNYLETDSLIIIARATTSGSLTNTVYVHKQKFDLNQTNDTARATITVAGCAVAHAGNDTAICLGKSTILGGSPTGTGGTSPYTYNWYPATGLSATNVANPTAAPVATTTYYLTVTDNLGCAGFDTVILSINANPLVTVASSKANYCSGDTIKLTSTPSGGTSPYAYNWSGPSSFASAVQNPVRPLATTVMSGIYSLTLTDHNGCSATASTSSITVNAQPAVSAGSSSTTYCSGSTIQLTSTPSGGAPAYSYTWSFSGGGFSPGNTQNPTRPSSTTAMSGTYTVTVNGQSGCNATQSVVVNPSGSTVTIQASATAICQGDTSHICAPAGFKSYQWSVGDTSQCLSATAAGNYYVTVTDNGNCTAASNHVTITVNTPPTVTITQHGDSLFASGALSYQWYMGNTAVAGATSSVYVPVQDGTYSVKGTDGNGCVANSNSEVVKVLGITQIVAGTNIKVYPNPLSSGGWHIEVGDEWIGSTCDIVDATGRVIYTTRLKAVQTEVELNVAQGVYLMRVHTTGQKNYTIKLIKL